MNSVEATLEILKIDEYHERKEVERITAELLKATHAMWDLEEKLKNKKILYEDIKYKMIETMKLKNIPRKKRKT